MTREAKRFSKPTRGEPGTKEAEALASALNHSAERVQTLWFSFLTFMLYLAIATGTTTHRMLFLEEPLNLPVLNIKLPLLGFYILAPIIFVVLHFYMLLNLVLLARTAKSFEDALMRAFPEDGEARENFRMRIENTLFVQLLVGGRLEREGINAWFLEVMAFITLALAPAVLLLMFEIMFLPYHSEWITWLHRGLLVVDLALVWTLWPGYRSGWGVFSWPKRSWWLAVPGVLSLVALIYAATAATFPDERMYLATDWLHGSWAGDKITPISTLDLHGEDLINNAKLKQIIEKNETSTAVGQRWVATLSLAGRDLTGANLWSADISHVDFSDAILNRANLADAWADQTRLIGAWLQGASLRGARLQGASLFLAQLQGADLFQARLQGASLDQARLQGASVEFADLQGASLNHARLQGSSLEGTRLWGAFLLGARLQGASLKGTQLQGASLDLAQLQGASLEGADLQGASLTDVCSWRADAREAIWGDARVIAPRMGAKEVSPDEDFECDWASASFDELRQLITKQVPEGDRRREATKMIEQNLDPTKALEGENDMAKVWATRAGSSVTPEAHERSLAELWSKIGCAADGAPYVVRALLDRLRRTSLSYLRGSSPSGLRRNVLQLVHLSPFDERSPEVPKLADAFLDDAHCAGASGLSEAEIAELKRIAAKAPRPAPRAPKP